MDRKTIQDAICPMSFRAKIRTRGMPERLSFFYCWTKQKYDTVESPVSDFEIDGKTFEVGGRNKGKKQISNLEDAYVVKDTIEYVFDNQVPLWMFGFLY